jgi:hypothetical protein
MGTELGKLRVQATVLDRDAAGPLSGGVVNQMAI